MPTRRRGVCVILAPAPIPVCLGVPGTLIFDWLPLDVFNDNASAAFFFAVLTHKISTSFNLHESTYSSR